jgi:hypothetical protein
MVTASQEINSFITSEQFILRGRRSDETKLALDELNTAESVS